MMKKKKLRLSTMFEEDLAALENKLNKMGVEIEELRYDLLYHNYDVFVCVNLAQAVELYLFTTHHALTLRNVGS